MKEYESLPAASSGVSRKTGQVLSSVHPRNKLRGILAQNRVLLIGGIFASFFVLVFFWKPILSIDKLLAHHSDILISYFTFDSNYKNLSELKLTNLFESRMYYPREQTLAYGNSHLSQSVISLPLYLLTKNTILSANIMLFTNFILSFLFVFLYIFKLTKSITSSLISGLIYTYNPFVLAHFPDNFEGLILFWIPLIFIATEKLLQRPNIKWTLLLALFLIAQLTASFYYALFLLLILPVYILLRIYLTKSTFRPSLRFSLLSASMIFLILSFLFLQPYIQVRKNYQVRRDMGINILLSAQFSDFLFTTEKNKLYGWMLNDPTLRQVRHPYTAEHPSEHALFPGLVVLILFGLLWWLYRKMNTTDRGIVKMFVILLALTITLSFGPYILIGNIQIPSLYLLIYNLVPFADALRAPARFMILGFLFIAVLSAFSFKYLESKFVKFRKYLLIGALLLISFEYNHKVEESFTIKPEIINFYNQLNSKKEIDVILELPIANSLFDHEDFRSPVDDTQYLLYGLFHDKKIVNGYHSFIPPDAVEFGNRLTINFPNNLKINQLKNMGVDTIIVHLDEFVEPTRGQDLIQKLKELGVEEFYSSDLIYAFKI